MSTQKRFKIDPTHSEVTFKVKHLGISSVSGNFEKFEGFIELDPEDLSTFRAEAEISTESISTGTSDRDAHLRSADFFEVEKYPTMRFRTNQAQVRKEGNIRLIGDLTIRDITRPLTLDVEFLGLANDPWGGNRIGISAEGELNRKDYNLTWNQALETGGLLVGDRVRLGLEVQAVAEPVEEEAVVEEN